MESLLSWRCGQFKPAGCRPRIPLPQSKLGICRCGVLLSRRKFHGEAWRWWGHRKATARIRPAADGFILDGPGAEDKRWDDASLAVWVDDPKAKVNLAWMRGVDSLQIVWRDVESGASYSRAPLLDDSSPGASLFVPFSVAPGEAKTISLRFAWYAPKSNLFKPADIASDSNVVSCDAVGCTLSQERISHGMPDVFPAWKS